MRRHYFLISAVVIVLLMLVAAGARVFIFKPQRAAPGGFGGAPGAGAPGGAGGAAGAGGQQRAGGPGGFAGARGGQQVTATTAAVRTFTDRIDVLGVAKGRQSVTLTSNTTQLVTAIRFRDGQSVNRGQVLVELRATEQDAGVDQAQAALEAARLNFERWNTLAEKGIAAPATRETYRASYDQAKASLAAAVARRGDREIRAPFSGVIGLSDIAPGALINPGTAIASLDDVSVVRVDFDIPDRFIARLRKGTPIIARTESYPDQTFAGTIAELDSRINERTRSIKARAELPNRGGLLKPGMLMKVGIEEASRQAMSAPESAVQFDGDQAFVFVIHRSNRQPGQAGAAGQGAQRQGGQGAPGGFGGQGGGQGFGGAAGGAPGAAGANPNRPRGMPGTVERRAIVAGQRQDGFIEIKSGLEPTDQIVNDGVNRLQNNGAVLVTGRAGGAPGGPGAGARGPGAPGQAAAPAGQRPAGGGQFASAAPGGQRPAGAPAAGGAGAAMGGAPGGGQRMDPAERFKMMDANGDGGVTKSEWRGPAERFDAIDTNKDGKISLGEMRAAPRPPGGFGGQAPSAG